MSATAKKLPIEQPQTRRTEGRQVQGRAQRVVDAVLGAAAKQFSRVGYAALKVEDVAEASGVNKTTIYRRWPTKADLLSAAIHHVKAPPLPRESGSLRDDMLEWACTTLSFSRSPVTRGLVRALYAERAHPEVDATIRAIRKEYRVARAARVQRAIDAGELPPGTDAMLVVEMVFAPIVSKTIMYDEPVDEDYVRKVVDIVLAGFRGVASE